MNLIGSRPTGWWRDRPGAMRALVEELEHYAAASGDEVAVVFDGRPFDLASESVDVAFASRRGRDAADDDIAARVATDSERATLTVVSSDAGLAQRVKAAGGAVESVGAFRRRLE